MYNEVSVAELLAREGGATKTFLREHHLINCNGTYINTILSLYYYLRVIKVMFFTPSDEPALSANPHWEIAR